MEICYQWDAQTSLPALCKCCFAWMDVEPNGRLRRTSRLHGDRWLAVRLPDPPQLSILSAIKFQTERGRTPSSLDTHTVSKVWSTKLQYWIEVICIKLHSFGKIKGACLAVGTRRLSMLSARFYQGAYIQPLSTTRPGHDNFDVSLILYHVLIYIYMGIVCSRVFYSVLEYLRFQGLMLWGFRALGVILGFWVCLGSRFFGLILRILSFWV